METNPPEGSSSRDRQSKDKSSLHVTSDDQTLIEPSPSSSHGDSQGPISTSDFGNLATAYQERYRLVRVVGRGGFGIVYLAHDGILDQDVAIKVMKFGLSSENDIRRFIFEARTGAKLRHPAIVNVFDIVQTGEGFQLVMEYYPGGTLSQLVKSQGALAPRKALMFTRQIASALAYAHKKNIIHRDIKPANIFLAGDDMVKLGDFGICAHTEFHDHTSTGEVVGTPLYMAPEQTKDAKDVDPRSDIFALGMTLYNMLTGKPPRVVDIDSIDPILRPLIKQTTAYERHARLVSAEQFMAMIDKALADLKNRASDYAPTVIRGGAAAMADTGAAAATATASGSAPSTSDFASAGDATGTQTPTTVTVQGGRTFGWTVVALVAVLMAGFVMVIYMIQGNRNPSERIVASPAAITPEPTASTPKPAAPPPTATPIATSTPIERPDPPNPIITTAPTAPSSTQDTATPTPTASPTQPPTPTATPRTRATIDQFLQRGQQAGNLETQRFERGIKFLEDWLDPPPGKRMRFSLNMAEKEFEKLIETRKDDPEPLYYFLLQITHGLKGERKKAAAERAKLRALAPRFFDNREKIFKERGIEDVMRRIEKERRSPPRP